MNNDKMMFLMQKMNPPKYLRILKLIFENFEDLKFHYKMKTHILFKTSIFIYYYFEDLKFHYKVKTHILFKTSNL